MKILLLKLLLIFLFLVLLFLFLRVLEGIAWYETGLVISKIVDPLSLSVHKLKILLDGRGISYDGVLEKQELTALVQTSGDVMEGELLLLEQEETKEVQSTSFSSGGHFFEEVEDKKDSVWIIQVIPRGHVPLLEEDNWKTVVKKVSHFGIRTGTFNCAQDNRFCRQRGWTRSILFLAMPEGHNQKDSVVMAAYPSANHKPSHVLNWVNARLAQTVRRVNEGRPSKERSQTRPAESDPIRLLLLSKDENTEAPLFFSAISLKYSGRIEFGQLSVASESTRELLGEKPDVDRESSHYVLVTTEGGIIYGLRSGEYLNHYAMDVYLQTIYPQANDFFVLSFTVANMLCLLELALTQGVLAKRTCHFLWLWVVSNAVLLMLWLPLLALTQVELLGGMFQFIHKLLRLLSQTALASQLRCMWIMHSSRGGLVLLSFLAFCTAVAYIWSRHSDDDGGDDDARGTSSAQWLQNTLIYYYNMLIRPNPGYTSVLLNNAHVEEGVNWNRLHRFPGLFLMADVSRDYIEHLPTWRYQQGNTSTGTATVENCRCWHASFLNDDKNREDDGEALRRYFQERVSLGKKQRQIGASVTPGEGESFVVTDYREMSNCSQVIHHGRNSNSPLPLPPENLGCVTHDPHLAETQPTVETKTSVLIKSEPTAVSSTAAATPQPPQPNCQCRPDLKCDPWPDGTVPNSECSICLESYVHGVVLCALPCGHAFHHQCVIVWLTGNRNHHCPNCRWPAYKTKSDKLSKHME